ncbi:FBD-associated F-box protein [Rhynchospora pubera]|uniref:FBD-associated F-box protein n=1 Tax=Rhynchospora pubera TaxID=906938 RepID=A0AAV8EZS0_9POAL|nr:FBD-associated F-box protein [Rhynchospora pubera]
MKRRSDRTDRISSLPDDALARVLSFLSARDAVRTCVLSKRWRNTWTIVPVLNFDFDEFPTELVSEDGDDDIDENIKEELKFDSFVCSVLENRGPSHLDTVTFHGEFMSHFCEPLMRWLDRSALLMPRVISAMIPVFEQKELNLPDSVFSCTSLELLQLIHCPYVGKAYLKQNSIALASLKTLMLVNLVLDDDFAQKLLLGCPVLQNLQLFDCELCMSDISSNVLKELILDDCWLLQHMRISCPALVSLLFTSCKNTIRIISLENLTSLVYATINLAGSDDEEVFDNLPKLKLISGLLNATYLKLLFHPLPELKEQLENDISNCGTFCNLKILRIGAWNMVKHFSLIALFLEHCPVLKQLALLLDRS